jgi:hypothetical protein
LTVERILGWADDHHGRTGRWPRCTGGAVPADRNEKWRNLDAALRDGFRGLPGGDSLPHLLARARGVRNVHDLPPLTERQILAWAKAHRRRTGRWPTYYVGAVEGAPGESWWAINSALRDGLRGLPGGSSLARLLASRLGVRNKVSLPRLRVGQILAWADAHRRRTGRWPAVQSGPIADAPGGRRGPSWSRR